MTDDSPRSLSRLLDQARQGDPTKRDELFQACRSYLDVVAQGQVQTWLRAKVDASDLVQQTMLEAHRDFDRFQGRTTGEWFTWLRRILNHNAADFVRHYAGAEKRAIRREVALRPHSESSERRGPPEPQAPGNSPSQQLARADLQLQVAAALQRLSADHQEVIMLRNLERLPFDEVARRMGRSRPATQMLWMRALKKLQAELGPDAESL